jgi:hypothetical protein
MNTTNTTNTTINMLIYNYTTTATTTATTSTIFISRDLTEIMWIIFLGIIIIIACCCGCYLCFVENNHNKKYIADCKARKRGDRHVLV